MHEHEELDREATPSEAEQIAELERRYRRLKEGTAADDLDDSPPECPKMSQNVPECPTMSHPNGPNGTSAPSDNDLSDNDLQDFDVPKCPKMSQNVPLSEKTAPAPVGSKFQVQSLTLGISDGTRRNVPPNVTECDGM